MRRHQLVLPIPRGKTGENERTADNGVAGRLILVNLSLISGGWTVLSCCENSRSWTLGPNTGGSVPVIAMTAFVRRGGRELVPSSFAVFVVAPK
jgi:hypothetical protein